MLNKALSAICLGIDRDRHRDTGTHFRLVFKTFLARIILLLKTATLQTIECGLLNGS